MSISYAFYTIQGWGASVRAHMCTPFRYLGSSWADYAEIWYVVRDQLGKQLTQAKDGVHLHVRTCVPLFHISGTVGRIALKFATWVESSPVMRVIQVMNGVPISACAQSWGSREHSAKIWCVVRPFNHESYTAMSKAYLHVCKCNCTSFYAYLFTSARS